VTGAVETGQMRCKPLTAFILSLLLPGLGQQKCGRWSQAAIFYAMTLVWCFIFGHLGFSRLQPPLIHAGMTILIVVLMLLVLVAAVEAALGARRAARPAGLWNGWLVCLGVLLLGDLLLLPAVARAGWFHIPSGSNEPTIQVGDYILAELYVPYSGPRPCDMAVFQKPSSADSPLATIYVKRLVAVGGDEVAYRQGRLILNGAVVPREEVSKDDQGAVIYRETLPAGCSYLIRETSDSGPLDDVEPVTVPPGRFYVLGDNRDDSADSRIPEVGLVPRERMQGRTVFVLWARDSARIGPVR
jgi:signal peptidase I